MKCGICQKKRTPKSTRPGTAMLPVTAVHPIKGGKAPGRAPTKSAAGVYCFIGV